MKEKIKTAVTVAGMTSIAAKKYAAKALPSDGDRAEGTVTADADSGRQFSGSYYETSVAPDNGGSTITGSKACAIS